MLLFPALIAGTAVVMDLKNMRVDNGWIIFSLCMGLILRLFKEGADALPSFAAGAILPVLLLGILFYFHMLGPGDIKVFCALGGALGVRNIICCIAVSFLTGAVISLAILIFCGGFRQRIQYFCRYFQEYLHTGIVKPYYQKKEAYENIHFTVPIFLSVLLYTGGVY